MNRQRMAGIGGMAVVCVLLAVFGQVFSKEKKGVVLDTKGNVIAEIIYEEQAVRYDCENGYEAYADLACREAAGILAAREEMEEPEAYRMLVEEEMKIRTALRQNVMSEMLQACGGDDGLSSGLSAWEKAAAVCDTKGHILACYSSSATEPGRNYVTYPTYAGSTIKPLSVYGPAVEDGTVCWSDLYLDSPYNQITDEEGRKKDWPVNTEPYSDTMWTVQQALKKSNNAIAVKILKDYGVEKSCGFIRDRFGMRTEEEQQSIFEKGEDSVLSNLALGYLEEGVTMRDMLSAYQTFSNGGTYVSAHAVTEIETGMGESYYEEDGKARQVFSPETAYILNRMLKTVTEEGGTGASAAVKGLDICGKTGTSDDNRDNWFIGMTPEYVGAVWHGGQGMTMGNEAAKAFKNLMEGIEHHKEISYPVPEGVAEEFYCMKTGLLTNEFCEERGVGYYKKSDMPGRCDCR